MPILDKKSQTLFRFVTVRSPEKVTIDLGSKANIYATKNIQFIYEMNAPFLTRLQELISRPSQTPGRVPAEVRRQVHALARQWMSSESYLLSRSNIEAFQLESIFKRLTQLESPSYLDLVDIFATSEGTHFIEFRDSGALLEYRVRAWDSLYALLCLGSGDGAQLSRIMEILRTIEILTILNSWEEEAEPGIPLNRYLKAKALLPKNLLPLKYSAPLPAESLVNDGRWIFPGLSSSMIRNLTISPKTSLKSRLESLKKALTQLNSAEPYIISEFSSSKDQDPFLVSPEKISRLSLGEVQSAMSEEGIPFAGARLNDIKPHIYNRLRDLIIRIPIDSMDQNDSIVSPAADDTEDPRPTPLLESAVRPLGVADLRLVEQVLKKYSLTEIAHVENVMGGEKRERTHRWLRRTEESETIEKEKSEERTHDLQTTEKSEVQRESSSVLEEREAFQAGLSVSVSSGPVTVAANAAYSRNNAKQEAARFASQYAKEVVDKAVERVAEKTRTVRQQKLLEEVEENNKHAFINDTDRAQVGLYRWLEKVYQCQVVNYGRRLMFEFSVPEPAYFYRETQKNATPYGKGLQKPPDISELTPSSFTDWNYPYYIKKFQLDGATSPPAEYVVISKSYSSESESAIGEPGGSSRVILITSDELSIPSGYQAISAEIRLNKLFTLDSGHHKIITGNVGRIQIYEDASSSSYNTRLMGLLSGETQQLSISLGGLDYVGLSASVIVTCRRLPETFAKWQLALYERIIERSQEQTRDYENQLRVLESRHNSETKMGKNPLWNRKVEQLELKKHCITLLTRQSFDSFDALSEPDEGRSSSEIEIDEAIEEGKVIQFFEQSFDWEKMTYKFFPYFWGSKKRWSQLAWPNESDDIFATFLSAGAAKVLVPALPGTETAVLYYLRSGEVWTGDDLPIIDDSEDIALVEELEESTLLQENPLPDGPSWNINVPTSLVILQDSGTELPSFEEEE